MTLVLRMIGSLGIGLFGGLFLLLVTVPDVFERSAVSFVKSEVTREVDMRFPQLAALSSQQGLNDGISRLAKRFGVQQDQVEALSKTDMPELIGALVENLCTCGNATPEGVAARAEAVRSALAVRASALGQAQSTLVGFIEGQYTATVAALRKDLLIFLGINTVAFAAVLGAAFAPRERRHAAVVPATLIVVATVISAATYIFGTDWFYTILFRDYVGFGYGVGLAVIFGLLADIFMNRARVCLNIISNLPSALTVPVC